MSKLVKYTSVYFPEHKQRLFWCYPEPEFEWDEDKLTYKEMLAKYPKRIWKWRRTKTWKLS